MAKSREPVDRPMRIYNWDSYLFDTPRTFEKVKDEEKAKQDFLDDGYDRMKDDEATEEADEESEEELAPRFDWSDMD